MSVVLIGTVDMSSSLFFVFIKNPECYANIGGIKGISWNNDNGL
jgi:hypothetical protein